MLLRGLGLMFLKMMNVLFWVSKQKYLLIQEKYQDIFIRKFISKLQKYFWNNEAQIHKTIKKVCMAS